MPSVSAMCSYALIFFTTSKVDLRLGVCRTQFYCRFSCRIPLVLLEGDLAFGTFSIHSNSRKVSRPLDRLKFLLVALFTCISFVELAYSLGCTFNVYSLL